MLVFLGHTIKLAFPKNWKRSNNQRLCSLSCLVKFPNVDSVLLAGRTNGFLVSLWYCLKIFNF